MSNTGFLLTIIAGLYALLLDNCRCHGFLLRPHVSTTLKRADFLSHCTSSSSATTSNKAAHNSIPTSTHAATTPTTSPNWIPQDLTKDNPGYLPIPSDDYIKKYQSNPKLWPVEFFVIVYRHVNQNQSLSAAKQTGSTTATTTQLLVRRSANGTSKYGVGTGVPVTRWMLSSQSPPKGYQEVAQPQVVKFDASSFPEFPKGEMTSWSYSKIDIREDIFLSEANVAGGDDDDDLSDDLLQEYASEIRQKLESEISQRLTESTEGKLLSSWDSSVLSTVKSALDNKENSIAAIQGSFRMSGLFGHKVNNSNERFVKFDSNAPNPATLAKSTRIYTMFPQMPDPMPDPSSTPKELKDEIVSRPSRMQQSGRDPHKDAYGRVYTHISTSNVSNTIHGVYITFDATDLLSGEDDVPPAYDLLGTSPIEREWVSLDDLKVTERSGNDGQSVVGESDTKSDFISGFIVRQLIRDGVIAINGD